MEIPSSREVVDLLLRWQRAELTERDVHHRAERWWAALPDDLDVPEWDSDSAVIHVLGMLDVLNQELIVAADVPHLVTFLENAPANPRYERERLEAYWASVDWERRRDALTGHPHYAVPRTRASPDDSER